MLRAVQDARQSVRAVGNEGHLVGNVSQADGDGRTACRGHDRQHAHEGAPFGGWQRRGGTAPGARDQRGGRNSKLNALTDGEGPPLGVLAAPGQLAGPDQLIRTLPVRFGTAVAIPFLA